MNKYPMPVEAVFEQALLAEDDVDGTETSDSIGSVIDQLAGLSEMSYAMSVIDESHSQKEINAILGDDDLLSDLDDMINDGDEFDDYLDEEVYDNE